MTNLTAREKSILLAFPAYQYVSDESFSSYSGQGAWGFSLSADIQGTLECSPRSATGSISSLVKKGVFATGPADEDDPSIGHWIFITEEGWNLYNELVATPVSDDGETPADTNTDGDLFEVRLTARERVLRREDGWAVIGLFERFPTKRAALRAAAALNREA